VAARTPNRREIRNPRPSNDARAAAGLRTSAAHARWEEIKIGDVDPVIQFTRELTLAHLG
jgi:hypothetical protein